MTGRLPDFLLIGAGRAGTTSLFRYLQHHPRVWMPANKELHYFDQNFDKGLDWYREQFVNAGPDQVVGEMTPSYAHHPPAPARMAEVVPDAKLVMLARHPVDRAYSAYMKQKATYVSDLQFADLIETELTEGPSAVPWPHHSYVGGSRYFEQVQRLLEHFPSSALLVLLTEDLEEHPLATYQQVCEHIGVDPSVLPPNLGGRYNRTRPVRSKTVLRVLRRYNVRQRAPRVARLVNKFNRVDQYPELDRQQRERLLGHYEADTKAFADWLGRDLSHWLQ